MRSVFFPNAFFDTALYEPPFYRGHNHVEETGQGYFIELDAPGFRKENVRISVDGNTLKIEAERSGRAQAKLRRAFTLPDDVDQGAIEAQMKDGVLELSLPKLEKAKPKLITVQDGKESFLQKLLGSQEKQV